MGLNIKNEETHQLVRRLAELTGQSQTSAVEDAVRRRLAEIEQENDREARIERLMAIGRKTAAGMDPALSNDPNDFLYDDLGLPR
ncbi:MAG TPA: type II toxin-antitoxin system VapB family antitoxin [Propionibacteriaceae bacterium]|nr:type II toxin-antitoxin system VapB family antitoxin [Propionibacteriaceae bacterium]